MNFEDEPYVRLYTRDTKTWLQLKWEGQAVFALLVRKLDRAGVLDDVTDPIADVALITGMPESVVAIGLERLLKTRTLELKGERLVCPRYVEAQTAIKSDRLRSAELRKRRRDLARCGGADDEVEPLEPSAGDSEPPPRFVSDASRDVSPAPRSVSDPSRGITEHHGPSRAVTPSLALPSLALPNDPPLTPAADSASTGSARAGRKPKPPRARSQCPLDLQPDETTAAEAWTLGFSKELQARTVAEFIDYWRGRGDLRADWQATLRNRLRSEAERRALKPRKPRDARTEAYQEQLRKATERRPDAVKPPPGFDAAIGSLFGG